MGDVVDLKSGKGADQTSREFAPPVASGSLPNRLAALSSRIWGGCAAIGSDMCNTMVSIEDAKLLDDAVKALRTAHQETGDQDQRASLST